MAEACIWCGHELVDETTNDELFACGSSHRFFSDTWSQSKGCMEILDLRERLSAARQVLERAERYNVESFEDSVSFDYYDHGQQVDAEVLDQTIEILRGNAPEIPDSSPITTDDLAAADYYEAVRQRVPWMVSVEHIEGLVEGYRRCGVPVWQTAEEIRKVHGGEYEQAE